MDTLINMLSYLQKQFWQEIQISRFLELKLLYLQKKYKSRISVNPRISNPVFFCTTESVVQILGSGVQNLGYLFSVVQILGFETQIMVFT